jgi:hypothetical protein
MSTRHSILVAALGFSASFVSLCACEVKINSDPAFAKSPSLKIKDVSVEYKEDLGLMVFSMNLEGPSGKTVQKAVGDLNGAPVIAYVFPTSLKAADVGMGNAEGIVALAITSHPDFDDTPLWDDDGNGKYDDDKVIYHTHWALLAKDDRVPGGLAVKEFKKRGQKCGPPSHQLRHADVSGRTWPRCGRARKHPARHRPRLLSAEQDEVQIRRRHLLHAGQYQLHGEAHARCL